MTTFDWLIVRPLLLAVAVLVYDPGRRHFEERERVWAGSCYEKGYRTYRDTTALVLGR